MRISASYTLPRCLFLTACWLVLSGFACPILCSEQTNIQVSYNEARDECRDYAEEKIDAMGSKGSDEKTRLVALFSECMKTKGWDVPGPSGVAVAAGPNTQTANGSPAAGGNNSAIYDREALARGADCAWARQNAASNPIAATRAEACDIECRQRLKANPYGPRPAACGPEYPEDRVRRRLVGNMEGEMTPAAGTPAPFKAAEKAPKKKAVKKKKKKAVAKKPQQRPSCDMPTAQSVLDKALDQGGMCPPKTP